MIYKFGDFTFDPARQELRRDDSPVHLPRKAMQLLEILLANRPNVVLHQDLYDRLWPDVIVVEANLKNLVSDLRNALGDHQREGRFLRTVHGCGYAFTDEAVVSMPPTRFGGRLVFLERGPQRIFLQPGENIVGRGGDANIVVGDLGVSRHHSRITLQPRDVLVEDLGSRNGTFVGSARAEGLVKLSDGDLLRLGNTSFSVRIVQRAEEATGDDASDKTPAIFAEAGGPSTPRD